jgi:TspO/MBR family
MKTAPGAASLCGFVAVVVAAGLAIGYVFVPGSWYEALQMVLNWLWSPLFFGLGMPWLAFAGIVALLGIERTFSKMARSGHATARPFARLDRSA